MRCYPVALLLGIVHSSGVVSDHASALAFATWRNEQQLEAIHAGRRALTLSAYEILADQLQGAERGASSSSRTIFRLLVAGSSGYLLLMRETWRFRLSMVGIILVATISQSFFYPLY